MLLYCGTIIVPPKDCPGARFNASKQCPATPQNVWGEHTPRYLLLYLLVFATSAVIEVAAAEKSKHPDIVLVNYCSEMTIVKR